MGLMMATAGETEARRPETRARGGRDRELGAVRSLRKRSLVQSVEMMMLGTTPCSRLSIPLY